MSDPLTDSLLVQRAGRGDAIAFSELVTRHYARALGVALVLRLARGPAEAAVQDAFARVQRRLPRLPGASLFYVWLYRQLVRACRPPRRAPHEPNAAPQDASPLLPLARAVQQLPFLPRAALALRELETFSYAEMAAILQVTRGRVWRALVVARHHLHDRVPVALAGAPACGPRPRGELRP